MSENPIKIMTSEQVDELVSLRKSREEIRAYIHGTPADGDVFKWLLNSHRSLRAENEKLKQNEKKVIDYILKMTNNNIGAGDDPIGFLIASHAVILEKLNDLKDENYHAGIERDLNE